MKLYLMRVNSNKFLFFAKRVKIISFKNYAVYKIVIIIETGNNIYNFLLSVL